MKLEILIKFSPLQAGKDKEVERLKEENLEMHNSKTHLLEMMDQKHAEISEKNATIRSYLDKIVSSRYLNISCL